MLSLKRDRGHPSVRLGAPLRSNYQVILNSSLRGQLPFPDDVAVLDVEVDVADGGLEQARHQRESQPDVLIGETALDPGSAVPGPAEDDFRGAFAFWERHGYAPSSLNGTCLRPFTTAGTRRPRAFFFSSIFAIGFTFLKTGRTGATGRILPHIHAVILLSSLPPCESLLLFSPPLRQCP